MTQTTPDSSSSVTCVVVDEPDSRPENALAVVASCLKKGHRVKVITRHETDLREHFSAHGCNLITEQFDSYLPGCKAQFVAASLQSFRSWMQAVYSEALVGVEGPKAFWATACTRLRLEESIDLACALEQIVSRHGHQPIHFSGGGLSPQIVDSTRAVSSVKTVFDELFYRLAYIALFCCCLGFSLLLRSLEFLREFPVRKVIESASTQAADRKPPEYWLALVGHWQFSCRHVTELLGRYAREHRIPVGVLLISRLSTQEMTGGHRVSSQRPAKLIPEGLEDVCTEVQQVVSFANAREYLAELPGTIFASLRCCWNAVRAPRVQLGFATFSPLRKPFALALLTTLDVFRAREAQRATANFLKDRASADFRVAFSHASLVADAVPDLVLQAAGVKTFDVVHGALAEALNSLTSARTWSSSKLVWTFAEEGYLRPFLPQVEYAGPSKWIKNSPARQRESRPGHPRILVCTNYATKLGFKSLRFPRVDYQRSLFDLLLAALSELGVEVEVRWRPHPGDDPTLVQKQLERFPAAWRLCTEKSILDSLSWADVLVTSLSSVLVEAVCDSRSRALPILVHQIPLHEDVLMDIIPPARRFSTQVQLTVALQGALSDLETDGPGEAENELYRNLFGSNERTANPAQPFFKPGRFDTR